MELTFQITPDSPSTVVNLLVKVIYLLQSRCTFDKRRKDDKLYIITKTVTTKISMMGSKNKSALNPKQELIKQN